jgi:hypothetical protein
MHQWHVAFIAVKLGQATAKTKHGYWKIVSNIQISNESLSTPSHPRKWFIPDIVFLGRDQIPVP